MKFSKIKKLQNHLPIIFIIISVNIPLLQARDISGKIVNEEYFPIEYANILLLNSPDSLLISGTSTNESGEFYIKNNLQGKQILKISCLGYLTQWMNIETVAGKNDLKEIVLLNDTALLDEVLITASVSPFSRKGNRLIANVANSLLSSAGTAQDVIERIPGITIKQDEIVVFSKGAPAIYINNRKLNNPSELQRLKSSDIASIELITNPEAKYDAESRAVVLIKTKQKEENGWTFHVSEESMQGKYFSDAEDIDLSYTYNNFSLFTSFHHSACKSYNNPAVDYTVHSDTIWKQLIAMQQIHSDLANQLTLGADWSITEKHALGGQYQGFSGKDRITASGIEDVWANEAVYDRITTGFDSREKPYQHLINAFYKGDYSESSGLRFDWDYMKAHTETDQRVNEISPIESRDVNITSLSDFYLYAGKLTVNHRFGDNCTLEWGGEYNRINGSGFSTNPEQYIKNSIYSNKEEKAAGFIGYSQVVGKLNVQLGIRYERVHSTAADDSAQTVKTDRNYQGFYPNLSLSQAIGNTQMGLELSRKTRRPPFGNLISNSYYVNRFLSDNGNPYLLNEDIYLADYNLTYKMLDFTLGYMYIKNPIAFTMENVKNNSSQSIMTYINYPHYQELNSFLSANFTYKIWNPRISIGITQPFFSVDYLGAKQKLNQTAFVFQSFNEIVFPKKYILSVNFTYQGKSNLYLIETAGYKNLDIGLRKSFLDEKLHLNLQVNDVFDWMTDKITVKTNNISYIKETERESRYVTLSVSYRFNNNATKRKYRGEHAAGDDIRRL
jgi:hypothetical protein